MNDFLKEYWFELIQSIAIFFTLIVSLYTIKTNTKTIQAHTILEITISHRDLWGHIYSNKKHGRVLSEKPNLKMKPPTEDEILFANMLLLHIQVSYLNISSKSVKKVQGFVEDIKEVLSFPIPNMVWNQNKFFYDKKFVKYVEKNIK